MFIKDVADDGESTQEYDELVYRCRQFMCEHNSISRVETKSWFDGKEYVPNGTIVFCRDCDKTFELVELQ